MTYLKNLLNTIIASDTLHAKWLNTLSYLENCGARKIAQCEHPTCVKEEMLKHASEEFRHAHHLKRQIKKVSTFPLYDYSKKNLLGGAASLNYLNALDIKTSRYLHSQGIPKNHIKAYAYLLVTYAIELRAEALYPIYHEEIRKARCTVTIKCIILEEQEHLDTMRKELETLPSGSVYANHVRLIESKLYTQWLYAIEKNISLA